jgi:hypothetical protein
MLFIAAELFASIVHLFPPHFEPTESPTPNPPIIFALANLTVGRQSKIWVCKKYEKGQKVAEPAIYLREQSTAREGHRYAFGFNPAAAF